MYPFFHKYFKSYTMSGLYISPEKEQIPKHKFQIRNPNFLTPPFHRLVIEILQL